MSVLKKGMFISLLLFCVSCSGFSLEALKSTAISKLSPDEKNEAMNEKLQLFTNKDTLCILGSITSVYIEKSLSILPDSAVQSACEKAQKVCQEKSIQPIFDMRDCKGDVTVGEWVSCMDELKVFLAEVPSTTNPYNCSEDIEKSERLVNMLKKTPMACIEFAKKCNGDGK